MGHNEKLCEKIFETPLKIIEKPYGIRMRAEPRRMNHTIGSKWLKYGTAFPIPTDNTTMESGSGRENVVSEIIAGIKDNPIKSGNVIDTVDANEKEWDKDSNEDNNGSKNKEDLINQSFTAGHISQNILEGEKCLNDGHFVTDPKRRRVNESKENRPNVED